MKSRRLGLEGVGTKVCMKPLVMNCTSTWSPENLWKVQILVIASQRCMYSSEHASGFQKLADLGAMCPEISSGGEGLSCPNWENPESQSSESTQLHVTFVSSVFGFSRKSSIKHPSNTAIRSQSAHLFSVREGWCLSSNISSGSFCTPLRITTKPISRKLDAFSLPRNVIFLVLFPCACTRLWGLVSYGRGAHWWSSPAFLTVQNLKCGLQVLSLTKDGRKCVLSL